MTARGEALTAFYGGPVWKAHREAANATMLDSDNVLLLHPTGAVGGFDLDGFRHDASAQDNIVMATIHYLAAGAASEFASFFDTAMRPRIAAPVLATLATETSPNSFPRLPVREGEHVFVWLTRVPSAAVRESPSPPPRAWHEAAPTHLLPQLRRRPETLRLMPTARSLLR